MRGEKEKENHNHRLIIKIRIQQIQLLYDKILARTVFFHKPRENTELAVNSIVPFMEESYNTFIVVLCSLNSKKILIIFPEKMNEHPEIMFMNFSINNSD